MPMSTSNKWPVHNKNKRSCGSCSMCCKVLGIPELDKPADKWCQHCDPGNDGCTIYEDRPPVCRTFECIWLQDGKNIAPVFKDSDRPDKIGIVFSAASGGAIRKSTGKEVTVIIGSLRYHGVFNYESRAYEIVAVMLSKGIPVVIGYGEKVKAVKLTVNGIKTIAEANVTMNGVVTMKMGAEGVMVDKKGFSWHQDLRQL